MTTRNLSTISWARLVGEGALIVVSVCLAIVLEGMSQDRDARHAARAAFPQMVQELKEDAADFARYGRSSSSATGNSWH